MRVSILILMALAFTTPAFAQLGSQGFPGIDFDDTHTNRAEMQAAVTSFENPGMLPDHPFYFLKRFGERMNIAFARGRTERARIHLDMARVRLAEAQEMLMRNKDRSRELLTEYGSELEAFSDAVRQINHTGGAFMKNSSSTLERCILSLLAALERAPVESHAALEQALNLSLEHKIRWDNQTPGNDPIRAAAVRIEQLRTDIKDKKQQRRACPLVTTAARDARGECQEFSTPCDVPTGWQRVDQCPSQDLDIIDDAPEPQQELSIDARVEPLREDAIKDVERGRDAKIIERLPPSPPSVLPVVDRVQRSVDIDIG